MHFFFTLVVLALIGNMIHDSPGGDPATVNWTMFVAVFSMLSLVYLLLVAFKEDFTFFPPLPFILDFLNTLFCFIAGVALAAQLRTHSCADRNYTKSNLITKGSPNDAKRCREAQASTAFIWFAFAAYGASLVLSALSMRSSGGGFGRKGGPTMSQVSHA
ncbi:MAG: hypothetical protein M1814_005497 [Vezdaea aestivalis]|nr:MAG: hypothetical protein M1814_005497 [Vezdaea aestivalis]